MFPIAVAERINVEYTGGDLPSALWPILRARIEEHGGKVLSADGSTLVFSNPLLPSALRSNWSLFTGVTGGTVQLEQAPSRSSITYSFSLRRLATLGGLFAIVGVSMGSPEVLLAVALLFGLNYVTSWFRLSTAMLTWVREVPDVFLRPKHP